MNAENRKRENTMDTKTIIVTLVCAVLCIAAFISGVYPSTAGGIM